MWHSGPMRRRSALAAALLLPLTGCVYQAPVGYPTSSPGPIDTTLDRSEIADAIETVDDCADGEVHVADDAARVRITGDCPVVTIDGYSAVVTGEDLGMVRVRGYGAVVLSHRIESVDIGPDGGGTLIQWESGQPQIADLAENTVLRKVG